MTVQFSPINLYAVRFSHCFSADLIKASVLRSLSFASSLLNFFDWFPPFFPFYFQQDTSAVFYRTVSINRQLINVDFLSLSPLSTALKTNQLEVNTDVRTLRPIARLKEPRDLFALPKERENECAQQLPRWPNECQVRIFVCFMEINCERRCQVSLGSAPKKAPLRLGIHKKSNYMFFNPPTSPHKTPNKIKSTHKHLICLEPLFFLIPKWWGRGREVNWQHFRKISGVLSHFSTSTLLHGKLLTLAHV